MALLLCACGGTPGEDSATRACGAASSATGHDLTPKNPRIRERVAQSALLAARLADNAAARNHRFKTLSSYADALPGPSQPWGYDPFMMVRVLRECHRLKLGPQGSQDD
jgi:hypothetical protein